MKIKYVEENPKEIVHHDDLESKLSADDVTDIAQIFKTPLTGSYNWDYHLADDRITRLYELGKKLNWNASVDVDWSLPAMKRDEHPARRNTNTFQNWPEFQALSEEQKVAWAWDDLSWALSQFTHGEQGALLVASQLVSCAPTYNAKLYAASQTFDEARHVEVFNRYLQERVGFTHPVSSWLKALLDKVLTDERWDLKFIGMQIIIEGLALAAFNTMKTSTLDPLLAQIVHYVIRDEARHVTFGVNYLEEFVATLTDEEREERAEFAFEACVIMRERLINTETPVRFLGCTHEEARMKILDDGANAHFRNLLFSRVVPNLKRIGLLTDKVRGKFNELGLLDYEQQPSDWEIDWVHLEKNLESVEEIQEEVVETRKVVDAFIDQVHSHHHGT